MALSFNFVVDRVVRDKIYPHLAQWQAEPYTPQWRQFGQHWPYTTPLRIEEYCYLNQASINIFGIDDFPDHCYYPVALAFFDFSIDYFALLPTKVYAALSNARLTLLFFYHEGDNPHTIKCRLDQLVSQHKLPSNCYQFVSGNTVADQLDNFVYFCDFEFWYKHRNTVPAVAAHWNSRRKDFVALNRLHKSWRATFMTDLLPLLSNSYWSYCETGPVVDQENPLEIDSIPDLRQRTQQFLNSAPYYADDLSNDDRNNHALHVNKFFEDAWMHIVIETHWDADQSGGAFITEKTFKPIKHAQPFFIAGCVGSLQVLRNLGYRTFDSVLDNSYDTIQDNTQRWHRLRQCIAEVRDNLPAVFDACRQDIEHNQQLFLEPKTQRLNMLLERLYEKN